LKSWSCFPICRPLMFIAMFSSATVAQALLLVCVWLY
jgi:hypothetical protein